MSNDKEPGVVRTPARRALTRDRIVEVAHQAIRRDGVERFSIRQLAAELGVTAPAVYMHVAGREDILLRVARVETADLVDRLTAIRAERPMDRLRLQAVAYVEWARRSGSLFRFLVDEPGRTAVEDVVPPPPPVDEPGDHGPLGASVRAVFEAALRAAIDGGEIAPCNVSLATAILWSGLNGATLVVLGRGTDVPCPALTRAVIDTTLTGLVVEAQRPGALDLTDGSTSVRRP